VEPGDAAGLLLFGLELGCELGCVVGLADDEVVDCCALTDIGIVTPRHKIASPDKNSFFINPPIRK
jgi:hypothetical protein